MVQDVCEIDAESVSRIRCAGASDGESIAWATRLRNDTLVTTIWAERPIRVRA